MTSLGPDDFPEFFKAVNDGREPFPWQTRLTKQVVGTGKWPSLLDLPTGVGKTAAIDIAVFHLACEADRGPARAAPLRILFVIDRRIVVDAAFERARTIAGLLGSAEKYNKEPILAKIAARLSVLAGPSRPPLDAVRLRGGVPQERDWARSPSQPLVAVSTVDQVGSRLLFRGYGVSPRVWPVHAGLVGADALWLLDEVHLSKPLEDTLEAIAAGHLDGGGILAASPRLAPFAVVKLSATPETSTGNAFGLEREDRQHPLLKQRLESEKIGTIEAVDGDAAAVFASRGLSLSDLGPRTTSKSRKGKREATPNVMPVRRIAIVVNRVDLARAIFNELRAKVGDNADVLLLTGRIRPLDRDSLVQDAGFKLLLADSRGTDPARPIILVATQTIEAGADLDFDALLTEIAPLDSLRQRFGRLDRLGTRGANRLLILHPKGKPTKGAPARDNPWAPITRIYGDSAFSTKEWLERVGPEIDFGINGFQQHLETARTDPELMKSLMPKSERAPVLLPAYADLWATTSPPAVATPAPSLFLHGPNIETDVQVVWRADVDPNAWEEAAVSLELCPPSALEALPVPVWAVRRWLSGENDPDVIADVPETSADSWREPLAGDKPVLRREVRQNGDEWRRALPNQIVAGDIIVVPVAYGGCDRFGWDPASRSPVSDFGAKAHYLQRRKAAIRVTLDTIKDALAAEARYGAETTQTLWAAVSKLVTEDGEPDADVVRSGLVELGELPELWRTLLDAMAHRRVSIAPYKANEWSTGFVIHAALPLRANLLEPEEGTEPGEESFTDRTDSSTIGVAIELSDHLVCVETKARDFGCRAGLDNKLLNIVALAARLHDLGKAEPRFQADLRGIGALLRMGLAETDQAPLLAKSKRSPGIHSALRASPELFRHEALSVALAERHPEVLELPEHERDLVLWLIGTHHGHGRPFFPPLIDACPDTEIRVPIDDGESCIRARAGDAPLRLDQGWFERAERVRHRFGPWELARLEAILRLADHAASADEQTRGDRTEASGLAEGR